MGVLIEDEEEFEKVLQKIPQKKQEAAKDGPTTDQLSTEPAIDKASTEPVADITEESKDETPAFTVEESKDEVPPTKP